MTNVRKKIFFLLIFSSLLFISSYALCHRVDIFCWVEGDQIKCEAKFTPGGPVRNGDIEVYAVQTGKKLLSIRTDDKGKASFRIPETAIKNRYDLKVVCNAEMGHKNFWTVRNDELPSAVSSPGSQHNEAGTKAVGLSRDELEKVISQVMSRQLAPLKKDIAELKEKKINLQDVLGGLGYIFGLAGIAFYFKGKH